MSRSYLPRLILPKEAWAGVDTRTLSVSSARCLAASPETHVRAPDLIECERPSRHEVRLCRSKNVAESNHASFESEAD